MNARLRVDPVACDAYGYCAELVPELISRDEWGYPVLSDEPVPPALLDLVRRAVADCPRRALLIVEEKAPPRSSRVRLASTRR